VAFRILRDRPLKAEELPPAWRLKQSLISVALWRARGKPDRLGTIASVKVATR
jgi:hypothetical protein